MKLITINDFLLAAAIVLCLIALLLVLDNFDQKQSPKTNRFSSLLILFTSAVMALAILIYLICVNLFS